MKHTTPLLFFLLVGIVLVFSGCIHSDVSDQSRIVKPENGTYVIPGHTLTVSGNESPDSRVTRVIVNAPSLSTTGTPVLLVNYSEIAYIGQQDPSDPVDENRKNVGAEEPHTGNWSKVAISPEFGPRYDFGTAVFHDRIWVIGGHTRNGYFWGCSGNSTCDMNDIWSSPDGQSWERVIDHAAFSPRAGHGVLVFHERLWVIGGSGTNDVWSSPDGVTWTLETGHAGFSPRSDMGVADFDNRLWVIGGGTFDNLKNDVWSSPDGITWTEITNSTSFSPRYGKGIVVFDDRLYLIGGTGDSAYTDPVTDYTYISEGGSKDVWSSANGLNWTLITADAPFKYQEFTPVVSADKKIWVIGGGNWETLAKHAKYASPHAFSEVWSSPDGYNWTLENEDPGFSPRFLQGVVVFKDGIWVLGGTDNYRISGDIWSMPLPGLVQDTDTTPTVSGNISLTQAVMPVTRVQGGINPISFCLLLLTGVAIGYYLKKRS